MSEGRWGSLHTHSQFSALDGTSKVPQLVIKAAKMGYPFLGLSDHGNMAGTTKLYKACKQEGILPYPGVEGYLIDPLATVDMNDKGAGKVGRFHLGLYARTEKGYKGLVEFVSLTHTRPRFNRFPRFTLEDLMDFGRDYSGEIIMTTGCYFGWLQQTLVNKDEEAAAGVLDLLAGITEDVIVEIQNHAIENHDNGWIDEDIVDALVDMAGAKGLPILATQDSHYLNQNQCAAHGLMKKMVYGSEEDAFPGDSFHLASDEWVEEHYTAEVWSAVEATCRWLTDINEVKITPLDKFTIHMPAVKVPKGNKDAMEWLRKYCDHMVGNSDGRYHDRLDYELDVIEKLGMANYFLHVWDYVEWCREENICIEARGSANGSLVCFLLGITQCDPIKWGLLFDRFLSVDRTKPPDIDMDIEDGRRADLLWYLDSEYRTTRIGTWGLLGSNEGGTGSVLRTYQTYRARMADDDEERKAAYATFQNLSDVQRKHPEDHEGLMQLSQMNSVFRSYGVHASGVLLSGAGLEVSEWIPTMLVASSDTTVTQYDMDDVEEWGLLKDDVLGQATLTVMRRCQELMGRDEPTDFSWIEDDDRAACAILREGRTDTGVFHFEGWTKSKGGKELGVKYTKDSILCQALYMPGAMDTGQKDLYLERRRDPQKRREVTYLHKAFEKALRYTYGAVIFQEQVIDIMRGLGMSIPAINVFFKVVKDSGRGATARNQERLKEVRAEFEAACLNSGIAEADLGTAWDMTAGFVAYGFNKAHATGYGLRSYRCAYLKAHYPLEFMSALLEVWSGRDKEDLYIKEARRMKLRMLPPHVNSSGVAWTMDVKHKAIRKGLLSIKGVGEKAAEEIIAKAPYKDIADLATRVSGRGITGGKEFLVSGALTGRLLALSQAGALDGL